ncbi:MAG: excinuclease ABC subunit UvrC [Myxococcota bacterium]
MSTHPDWLKQRLARAPRAPGCYLMKDRSDRVVYVGKASDLRARLGQYFAPNTGDTRFFVGLLDRTLGDIDVIVTGNAKEALVLENELIKRHNPRFNVRLKDDKSFLCLRIGKTHEWPRVQVVRARNRKLDGADYFGPYASSSAIRQTLRVINRHFGLRTCTDVEFKNRARPCLEHQIGRCPAPCVLPVDREVYGQHLEDVRLLLRGRSDTLVGRLEEKMAKASEELEFELAAHYRDQIQAIGRILERQNVDLKHRQDIDVIGLYREGADGAIQVLEVRRGVLVGASAYPLKGVELPDKDVIEDALWSRYDVHPVPDIVLTPQHLPDAALWSELLTELRGRKVSVTHPQRGDKRRLLEMATRNAEEHLASRVRNESDALATLEQLQKALGLRQLPARIECYDISNIQGTDAVGSMVVAMDGVISPKHYRHFKIRGEQTPDDYRMMQEVLSRRFKRGRDTPEMPDLILIDGGKGQLKVAQAILDELGLPEVEAAGLAKSRLLDAEGHVMRGPGTQKPSSSTTERSDERVFRPGRKNHVALRPNSNGMHLLVRLRDEAHRFAITHHRSRRRKRSITSALDAIKGVGPSRRKALLSHFGSVKRIREAEAATLTECAGISAALAARIHEALNA